MSQIFCFHGFWGRSKDFDFLADLAPRLNSQSIEYTSSQVLGPELFFSDWGIAFRHWASKQSVSGGLVAVGYSQGGRLLLQAFERSPSLFEKLILISTHPGLQTTQERESRLKTDRKWAHKFRTDNWESLQKEWSSQDVFKMGKLIQRREDDFDRETLALCFENWSLAHQPDFREMIVTHQDKIKVIVGEYDSKYRSLYEKMQIPLQIAKGAAHRVPSDQPEILAELLNSVVLK